MSRLTKHYNMERRPGEKITASSARRRARERKATLAVKTDCQKLFCEKQKQAVLEMEENRRLNLLEMNAAEPWGKPGCGAPNPDAIRRRDLRHRNLYPEDEIQKMARASRSMSPIRMYHKSRSRTRKDDRYKEGDEVKSSFEHTQQDPQTSDRQQAYMKHLDDLVEEKRKLIQEEMSKDRQWDKKRKTPRQSWVRAGPVRGGPGVGNPTRNLNSKQIGYKFNESMGWTDNNVLSKIKRDLVTQKRNRSVNLPPITKQANKGDLRTDDDPRQEHELVNPNDDYASNKEDEPPPETNLLEVTGGLELIPLLARRRKYGPKTLGSSDVTKLPPEKAQWRVDILGVNYLEDLMREMNIKRIRAEENKKLSAEDYRRHCETWDKLWGRPGHGAPRGGRPNRVNLDLLLHSVPLLGVH